eukprot:ctg_735.g362
MTRSTRATAERQLRTGRSDGFGGRRSAGCRGGARAPIATDPMAFVGAGVRGPARSRCGGRECTTRRCLGRATTPLQRVCALRVAMAADATGGTASASGRPLRMEDVCEVGRKRDAVTGNIRGLVYVVQDNIDTDVGATGGTVLAEERWNHPAERLSLLPSIPAEYQALGSYAMEGLPRERYPKRFVEEGQVRTPYAIIVAGNNFGCGSSREHAPIALGAAGAKAVVALSYARIFFRNCSATGELYPLQSQQRLVDAFQTGDEAVIDFERDRIINLRTDASFPLEPLGDVGPVIDAGGLFAYARKTGMIAQRPQS